MNPAEIVLTGAVAAVFVYLPLLIGRKRILRGSWQYLEKRLNLYKANLMRGVGGGNDFFGMLGQLMGGGGDIMQSISSLVGEEGFGSSPSGSSSQPKGTNKFEMGV